MGSVIQNCPNLTKIHGFNHRFHFWDQIVSAAAQGQLSRIKTLPSPAGSELDDYIEIALLFKDSLTDIQIIDDMFALSFGFQEPEIYTMICDRISLFKNLQHIHLCYVIDKHLSYFNELIDKCLTVNTLTFDLMIDSLEESSKPEPLTPPRLDIHTFKCNWRLINSNGQLIYLMRKFPNLQSLKVDNEMSSIFRDGNIPNIFGPILEKFIQYAMSIPVFEIKLLVRKEDISNIWNEFTKEKHGSKNVTIKYAHRNTSSNHLCTLELCVKTEWNLLFPTYLRGEPQHIAFLSMAGKSIRSLNIVTPRTIPLINTNSLDWLFEILRLCPLTEELMICESIRSYPDKHTIQYPSVKKLAITGILYPTPLNYLNCLSLCLPNIRQLYLKFAYIEPVDMDPIVIDMPHTCLDLLTWKEEVVLAKYVRGAEIYIKLKTNTNLRYYLGIKNLLYPVDKDRYLSANDAVRFDIDCIQLKELRIKRNCFLESNSKFIF